MSLEDTRLSSEENSGGKLLSPEEREICEFVAVGESPYNQRAQALLALDEGATLAVAGQRAGQTLGQVRYWLGKFRDSRTGIFPGEHLPQSKSEPPPAQQSPGQPSVSEEPDMDTAVEQDTKREKSKGAPAKAGPAKRGKAKTKKGSKKKSKTAQKEKGKKNGKKKKGARKGEKTQGKKNGSGAKIGKKKKG